MKKFDLKMLSIWAILLVVFIAVTLLLPIPRGADYWLAFGCTIIAFLLLVAAWALSTKDGSIQSRVFGAPIFLTAQRLFVAQLIIGLILMAASVIIPWQVTAIIEIVMLAVMVISLIGREAARDVVVEAEAKIEDRTAAWKAIRAKAVGMPEKVRDALRYADPTPTSLDGEIGAAVEAGDAEKVMMLMERRKMAAKEGKSAS